MVYRCILLESIRQLRNVRSLAFTFVIPLVMLLVFGSLFGSSGQQEQRSGLPWLIVTTVQMASYGGKLAALSQAFAITTERSIGWNRHVRITPLSGVGYLMSKVAAALLVALGAVIALCAVSIIVRGAPMDAPHWSTAILGIWIGVIPFALIAVALGQFARPSFAQPLFTVVFLGMAILGGLWIPLEVMPPWVISIAQTVPSYWLNKLGQIGADGAGNTLLPVVILAAWTVALAALIT